MLCGLQQAEVFTENTALRVQGIRGDMGVDDWSEVKWQFVLNNDLLVCTPQILLNILRRAYIKVKGLNSWEGEQHAAIKQILYCGIWLTCLFREMKDLYLQEWQYEIATSL